MVGELKWDKKVENVFKALNIWRSMIKSASLEFISPSKTVRRYSIRRVKGFSPGLFVVRDYCWCIAHW